MFTSVVLKTKVLCVSLLFAVLLLMGCAQEPLGDDPLFTRRLAEAKAKAKQVGIPLIDKDIPVLPKVPDAQNAATFYRQIEEFEKNHKEIKADKDFIDMELLSILNPTPAQVKQGKEAFAHLKGVLDLMDKALACKTYAVPIDWSDTVKVLDAPFPQFARLRGLTRLVTVQARLLVFEGKPVEAVAVQAKGFGIARHVEQYPVWVARLVGIAIRATTLRGMEDILDLAGEQPHVAQAVHNFVGKAERLGDFGQILKSEAFVLSGNLESMRGKPISIKEMAAESLLSFSEDEKSKEENSAFQQLLERAEVPNGYPRNIKLARERFINANLAHLLEAAMAILSATKKPYYLAPAPTRLWGNVNMDISNLLDYVYPLILLPTFDLSRVKDASIAAKHDTVLLAAQVLAKRPTNTAFPEKLTGNDVPTDPFDGKPMKYRKEGSGFVVWSVGKTSKFDGGTPTQKPSGGEVAVRYPTPAYRLKK